MSPTLAELERRFDTTLKVGDLVNGRLDTHDQVTQVGLEVKHGTLERLLSGESSAVAVELESISITGPSGQKRIEAKSGPRAGTLYDSIIKAEDRQDPWAPKL